MQKQIVDGTKQFGPAADRSRDKALPPQFFSEKELWRAAQERLGSMLSADTYNTWFAPLRASALDTNTFVLEVPNDSSENWLKDNYMGLLREVLGLVSGQQWQVKLKVASAGDEGSRVSLALPKPAKTNSVAAAPEQSPVKPEPVLNPKNTFDTFVVGAGNDFACAAALAVAQAPGKAYNPLFLFGGVGLGKTHLLHAIGHYVLARTPGARVTCVSAEAFTNEYVDSIQNDQLARFREKYRRTDVLLIDDVQYLAGNERAQDEFFHTFNALYENERQIVLTCDRPAGEIQNLEQRLLSRFDWGLVTDLQPPDVETRLAILRKKALAMRVTLPEDILDYLANRSRTNIRELEGALVRVASYAILTGRKVSLETVEGLVHPMLHENGHYTISDIQRKVAERFDIPLAEMTGRRRSEKVAFPRQVAMYISRQTLQTSLSAIGEAFGGRDHATVLRACQLVKDRMQQDPKVRQAVTCLEKQFA
jgi:chromosomal replication initiator protein